MEQILMNIISGAIGGNAVGAVDKKQSLGLVGNTIAGLVGGTVGSQILQQVIGNAVTGITGDIGGAAVSGAITIYLVNLVKKHLLNKTA
jgi:uncharacterized membrane protein YeaQ/YmgE (transglycosylase-associated protein family)